MSDRNTTCKLLRGLNLASLYTLALLCLSACSVTGFGLFLANSVADHGEFDVINSLQYGSDAAHQLNIYKPKSVANRPHEKLPVVVFFYGGCWGACNTFKKEKYAFVAEAFTTNNYIVVIPDYRLYPDVLFPEIIADASLVVEWVKGNIGNHGGDAESVFLMGHSAGAHLAATLVADERYLQPDTQQGIRGFVGLAGPYDFLPFDHDYQKVLFGPQANHANSQPVNFIDGSEPPMLLLYGNKDDVVKPRNIESLSKKANQMGVDVTAHRYAGLSHGGLIAALSRPLRNSRPVANDVVAFLDRISGEHN